MSADKKLIPINYKVYVNELLQSQINSGNWYVFVGDNGDHQTQIISEPTDDYRTTHHDAYNKMIFGKRIGLSDTKMMVRNIPYESNKAIDMYDDQDTQLNQKDFFCVVNAGSYYHVFKCLDNNRGANSTVQPDFTHISGANSVVYQTSDDYKWKYMYSISDTDYLRFATTEYIPVVPNTTVQSAAVEGAIDNIVIDETGRGYDNHLEGRFSTGTLRVDGNNRVYMVTNSVASTANDFYNGCIISITAGAGVGQNKTIEDYFVNSSGKYIVTNSSFTTALATSSVYEIMPGVMILGADDGTSNALARALVNSSSQNSISQIEMINAGSGYRTANAYVIADESVGIFAPAELRPIISPPGGHGANAAAELYSMHLAVTVKFQNTESGTIPANNGFQQVGLIKNPLFANVEFELTNAAGTFLATENVARIAPVKIEQNVTINTTSYLVTSNTGDFENQLEVGEYVYLTEATKTDHMIGVVNAITNSSQFELTVNGFFESTEAILYKPQISTQMTIIDLVDAHTFRASNVEGYYEIGDFIVGLASGAKAQINAITRNDVSKGFDTFLQMYKYTGDELIDTFTEDEVVYQFSSSFDSNVSTANALFHSIESNGGIYTMYVTEQKGKFRVVEGANTITGVTSEAQLKITGIHEPELVHGSGDVVYLVNTGKNNRANNQTELIRLIYELE